jgi:3-oxoacyl-[acyl-carrier protein] reductase
MKQLQNKVVFVTGGSRGIGAGIARRMAAEGADVVITYVRNAAKAQQVVNDITNGGQRALAIAADSADPRQITAGIQQAIAEFGKIDVLVNNAGVFVAKPFGEFTMEEFNNTMDVNVRAVFAASQAASRHMAAGARIITIGSNMAYRVAAPNGSLYAMSKSALIGLTKGMARDLGPKGITVNLVQPGPTDTDMNPATGAHADFVRSGMAIPQYGQPADIASLVSWLAGSESKFMTGAVLTMDGGFSI